MEEEESLKDDRSWNQSPGNGGSVCGSGSLYGGDDCEVLCGAGGVNFPGSSFGGNRSSSLDLAGTSADERAGRRRAADMLNSRETVTQTLE